ncbi:hypothetical protein ALP05_02943 [Pseudomonas caricapapayae]|uniref:Uncharacterized protein n=1 Tax=Pseudomonas caricapapayae TaxID=46678 RepID=A0A3M6EZN2_9PSED|nr:hypothetical protein [Pseudomonas caricapapayae]RMV73663.1 hypothetical protein ALP05_02943 [Pseudomonas caricapapayae]
MNISTQLSNFSFTPTVVPASSPDTGKVTDESLESSSAASTAVPAEGVKVSLSSAGIQKSADDNKPKSNADIESSGLPDQTQKTLKMIRELKRQIEEKQQELQSLMADQSMDPEIKKSKIGALVTEISTLTAGLATANNALVKQARAHKISPDQLQQAQQLAAK